MRTFVVDYLKDPQGDRTAKLLHKALKIYDTPRLILLCRLFGHKPVVDGTPPTRPGALGWRWVCCDRCGVRPEPQGSLDPEHWDIGDVYSGDWAAPLPDGEPDRRRTLRALKGQQHPPGPWPKHPAGALRAEIVLGRTFGGAGVELQIGCAGEEDTVSAHLLLHRLGALYLSAQSHGTWLQRRLNRRGYHNRVIEFGFAHNGFLWKLWTKSGEWSSDTPRWRDGSICLNPLEWCWGPVRHKYEDIGEPECITVRMPHGDDHEVTAVLQRVHSGRARSRRQRHWWSVQWESDEGIPVRDDDGWKGGSIYSAGVDISDEAVRNGHWPEAAAAAIAASMTYTRGRENYQPVEALS